MTKSKNEFFVTPSGKRIRLDSVTDYYLDSMNCLKVSFEDKTVSIEDGTELIKRLDEHFGIELDWRKYE